MDVLGWRKRRINAAVTSIRWLYRLKTLVKCTNRRAICANWSWCMFLLLLYLLWPITAAVEFAVCMKKLWGYKVLVVLMWLSLSAYVSCGGGGRSGTVGGKSPRVLLLGFA